MILLFIGNNKEILGAFSENIRGVDTIIISSNPSDVIIGKYHYLNNNLRLLIIDLNTTSIPSEEEIALFFSYFPQIPLWAIYDPASKVMKEEILARGFSKIISYDDDLAEIIAGSGLFQ